MYPMPIQFCRCQTIITYVFKNIITRQNIEVGDYTYYDDFEDVHNFEKNVKYHFGFTDNKLIIGRFCMIASGVTFITNGANHLTDAVSTNPFAIFGGDWSGATVGKSYPTKGDTVVGNDVWIGYRATIMAVVHIGDGAIIAVNSTVVKDVAPYSIAGGKPATFIRQRLSNEQIAALLRLQWWNRSIEKITDNVQKLTSNKIEELIEMGA